MPGRRWTAELQAPVVLEAIRLFGADRCMVASNFPVDGLLASPQPEVVEGARAGVLVHMAMALQTGLEPERKAHRAKPDPRRRVARSQPAT